MLPHCPYCHTVYRYRDLTVLKGKTHMCYHCHKTFAVRRSFRVVPVVIACVLLIAVNLIVFWTSQDINKNTFLVLIMADAAVILLSLLTAPLFTRLVKLYRS